MRLAAPLPPRKVPVVRSRVTPVVWMGVDQFVEAAAAGAAAGFLAEQDGAPGGAPHRVTLGGASNDQNLWMVVGG